MNHLRSSFHDYWKHITFPIEKTLWNPWYLYEMVNQNMFRTHKGKKMSEKKFRFALGLIKCIKQSNDRDFSSHVRSYFWDTI